MSTGIVATEEVRDSIARGHRRARAIGEDLAVSTSTARRHALVCVERGWATNRQGVFTLTPRGREANENNEAF